MSIWRKLTGLALSGVILLGGANAPAFANVENLDSPTLVSQSSQDGRSIKESDDNSSLELQTLPGDKITISNSEGIAIWTSKTGELIATIQLNSTDSSHIDFSYDPFTKTISPISDNNIHEKSATTSRCIPKWLGWSWGVIWGGLVCLPLGVGVSGVATPIAGVVTGQACTAAGGALVTAKSC